MEITPESEIRIATTHAKTGWSMKNLDMVWRLGQFCRAAGFSPCGCASDFSPCGTDLASAGAAAAGLAAFGAPAGAAFGFQGVGLAVAPSLTFCRPAAMTWSPAARPEVTSHLPSRVPEVST